MCDNNSQCRNDNEESGREGEKGQGAERSGQVGKECSIGGADKTCS